METIEEHYSVMLDLSDPESNIGKVLYDYGDHQIYVSGVIVDNPLQEKKG